LLELIPLYLLCNFRLTYLPSLQLPPDVDIVTFVLFDGKPPVEETDRFRQNAPPLRRVAAAYVEHVKNHSPRAVWAVRGMA